MKRHGDLWPQIIEFENLMMAARQAQKGKRFRANVLEFNYQIEQELWSLHTELKTLTYQPGAYRTFRISDPKPRLISAAPYRDRVGFRILPDRIRVRNDNLRRSRKRLKALQRQYEAWEIDLAPLVQRLQSWEAHLMHGDTHRLRRKLFDYWVFMRGDKEEGITARELLEDEDLF